MGILYFAKTVNPISGIQEGFTYILQKEKPISPGSKILLMIDILFPEGFPTSINPTTLMGFIEFLNTFPDVTITILPNAYWNTNPQRNLELLGLTELLLKKNCQIANFTEFRSQPLNYLAQFSYSILFSQTRIDPMLGVWTSFCSLAFFNPKCWTAALDNSDTKLDEKSPRKIFSDRNFFHEWFQMSQEVLLWKQPDIIIEDLFEFAEGNGPFIYSGTNLKKTDLQIISTDYYASNAALCTIFKINPEDHPILKYNVKFTANFDASTELIIENRNVAVPISYKKPQSDLNWIRLPGLKLLLGDIGDGIRYQLIQLLSNLQAICVRDTYHMEKWVLLAGKNPPQPPENIPIVIFGKDAIETTTDFEFRRVITKKKVLPDLEIDNTIFRNDSILRDKIRQLEAHYNNIKAEIAQKQNPLDREEAMLRANKKLEKTILNMRYKKRKNDLKLRFQNKKAEILNETPTIKLNQKILEIPEEVPFGLDAIQYLVQNWSKTDIPCLIMYWKGTKAFYDYPPFKMNIYKTNLKKMQQALTKDLKIKYEAVAEPKKIKLKELQTGYKQDLAKETEEYKKAQKEIAEKYQPQELDLKNRQKAQLKANIQEKKELLQKKFAKKEEKPNNGLNNTDIKNTEIREPKTDEEEKMAQTKSEDENNE
jgi:uncharacterized protein (DUF362 family)